MDKIPCPHVNVIPTEVGDLFGIYEVPKNATIQLMKNVLYKFEAEIRQVNHKNIDKL